MTKKLKIAYLTDMDITGSGYRNLSIPICVELVNRGHEVKVVGFSYKGQEHSFPFTIIPVMGGMMNALSVVFLLHKEWNFDILIVAMDIPVQRMILAQLQQIRSNFKYFGIMPVEADPLCMSWAMVLIQMDKAFIISEFGTQEAQKSGVISSYHIPIGLDVNSWPMPTPEQKKKFRKAILNVDDDKFIVLTVADNQERKNLDAAFYSFSEFVKTHPNSLYVLVTRIQSPVGYALDDLAAEYGISDKFVRMERGLAHEMLWMLYAAADCFLLTSKAEGLGMPLLEAMAVGVPCIATDCTGMREVLSDNRGILVEPEYVHRDAFGNGRRYWVDKNKVILALDAIKSGSLPDIDGARKYIEGRTWEKSVDILDRELNSLFGDENGEEQETIQQ